MSLLFVPLAIGWFGGLALALLDGRRRSVALAAAAVLAAMGATTLTLLRQAMVEPVAAVTGGWPEFAGIPFRADPLGALFATVALAALLLALLFETGQGILSRSFPALVVLLGTGLCGLFLTADLFNFYVFFELSMMTSFGIAAYGGGKREVRAALVFVLANLLGTVAFLTGIAGLYHLTGALAFDGVREGAANAPAGAVLLSAAMLFVALSVKLGVFPFHSWLPPVYRSSHRVVAAILSGVLANIGVYGVIRLSTSIVPRAAEQGRDAILILGIASALYGGVVAAARRDPRDLLAYSSIAQVGFILIAIAAGGSEGLQAAILYAVVNSINKTLLFLATEMRGAWISAAFAAGALSVAGVPPAAGFIAKLAIFGALASRGETIAFASVLAATALSFVYIFRGYQRTFWKEECEGESGSTLATAAVMVLAAGILLIGVWPEPLFRASGAAVAAMRSE